METLRDESWAIEPTKTGKTQKPAVAVRWHGLRRNAIVIVGGRPRFVHSTIATDTEKVKTKVGVYKTPTKPEKTMNN